MNHLIFFPCYLKILGRQQLDINHPSAHNIINTKSGHISTALVESNYKGQRVANCVQQFFFFWVQEMAGKRK